MLSHRWFVAIALLIIPFAGLAAECIPTPHRSTGTHYEPVTEQKTNISRGIVVRGRILATPDCTPVANAKIVHWQADKNGEYVDRLRAYLFSDKAGGYEFETEWPALSIPHIHFIVTAEGYRKLETQWVGSDRVKSIDFDMVLRKQ